MKGFLLPALIAVTFSAVVIGLISILSHRPDAGVVLDVPPSAGDLRSPLAEAPAAGPGMAGPQPPLTNLPPAVPEPPQGNRLASSADGAPAGLSDSAPPPPPPPTPTAATAATETPFPTPTATPAPTPSPTPTRIPRTRMVTAPTPTPDDPSLATILRSTLAKLVSPDPGVHEELPDIYDEWRRGDDDDDRDADKKDQKKKQKGKGKGNSGGDKDDDDNDD